MKKFKLKFKPFSKRQLFVFSTIFLVLILLATQLISVQYRYPATLIVVLASFVFSAFCLREDLSRHEWLTLLILPTMFTLAVSYFYFLLPVRWITRLPVAVFYGIGFYALLLTENIFNVAGERTIQLIRAAQTVGFYLTIVTSFLLFYLVMSLNLPFYANGLTFFVVSLLLFVQHLWSVELTEHVERKTWTFSLVLALLMGEIGLTLSFWPLKTLTAGLMLTSLFYALLGLAGYHLQERLLRRVAFEFVIVPLIIFLIAFLTTSWTA